MQGRAVILAGSHALSALLDHGIDVDVVLVQDPGPIIERHFAGQELARIGALVLSTNVTSNVARVPVEPRFFFAVNGPLDQWVFPESQAHLASGGSVACAALSLAILTGADPIVLVGQDLAFAEGRYYAPESLDGNARVERIGDRFFLAKPTDAEGPGETMEDGRLQFTRARKAITLPGWHGGDVESSESFAQFRAWFGREAFTNRAAHRFINATEGGVSIEHFESLPFAEACSNWTTDVDAGAILEARAALDPDARQATVTSHVREAARPGGPLEAFLGHHGLRLPTSLAEWVAGSSDAG